ncbi:MAG TPA: peptide ABC transporter substrate-binding protein [Stellaceae bacterium]|nr:peptide ABC transporter substrate-binding protein [Stellaceae bacterium]
MLALSMRRVAAYLLGFLVLTAAAPATAGSASPGRPGDTLAIGISQFPATLNPLVDAMLAKSYVLAMVRRPLTTYDPEWHLVCMLCVELPSFENGLAEPLDLGGGKKGVRLTYTLQPDARWGDGVPVTTEDVLFSYEVGKNPKTGVADAELYRRILRIEAKDAKTFTLDVDRLTFDYAGLNDFEILPAHIERAAFADPAQYRIASRYDTDPTNPGLYDGPYRITESAPGSHIVFERNPFWWGKAPYFRRIVVWTVENTAALEANLLAHGIDMVAGELGFPLDEALAFEQRHGQEFRVIYKPGLTYEHIDLNLDDPILADLRVRQALLLAIDRKAISEELFAGRDPVAESFVPPLDWIYTDKVPHYPYDPAQARTLLEAAGWHLAGGAIRRNDAGARLSLALATTTGDRTRELVEEVLQSEWRQIGVDVRLHNQPARVLFGDALTKRNFAMAMFAWISAPENVPRSTLRSDEIPSAANSRTGQNYAGFRNAGADRLIDAIEVELDRGRRAALWHALQRLYAEELPALPLYFRASAFVLPPWLEGVTPTGHQYPSTLWVERWRAAPPS